jgi:hypothetical protein
MSSKGTDEFSKQRPDASPSPKQNVTVCSSYELLESDPATSVVACYPAGMGSESPTS